MAVAKYYYQYYPDHRTQSCVLALYSVDSFMLTRDFLDEICHHATKDGGVTVNVRSNKIIERLDEWLFPRWPGETVVTTEKRLHASLAEFLSDEKEKIFDKETLLGIWLHDGKYYIDLNAHVARFEDAVKLARTYGDVAGRHVISAYNPARDETREFPS